MKKFKRHLIYFWLTFIFCFATISSIGNLTNFLLYAGMTAIIFFINYLMYITSGITIDGNMVEGRIGIIHTQKLSSSKSNITSVKVSKNILGRILNYGTIHICTASSSYVFKMMKNPDEIKNEILK